MREEEEEEAAPLPVIPASATDNNPYRQALSLVLQGRSGAVSSFQVLLSDQVPNVHNNFTAQLLIFTWLTSAASTMYGAIVYLTIKLAEPETEMTKALVNGCEDVETISLWIIVARCFQSVFAISASLTMISAPDYDLYAFK